MENDSGKRIVKNTLLLYVRMIVVTIVSFYTTRITLQLLGVEDYGIRNVVSGIIGFLGILTTAMVNAAQRFLAFDLGRNNLDDYNKTFCMLINVFFIISVIGVLLMELFGPYVISTYLVIPPNRLAAAQCIFQFTIIGFFINTLIVPYQSAVITHEHMNIFAYVSLLDAALKLSVVYLLYIVDYDKLITVVFLTVVSTAISSSVYLFYCIRKWKYCRYKFYWDANILRKLSSFMGWNLFGTATSILNVQGLSLLLNMFFGPTINTAKAIADNVQSLIQQFVSNFYMAVGPQIIKSYANNELDYTKSIVLNSSKFASYLIVLISMPLVANMRPLLEVWLGQNQVSDIMVLFAQWMMFQSIAQSMDYPITQTVRATGDIKKYQIQVGLQTLLFIPFCYIAFKLGADAIVSMIILTLITMFVQVYRSYALSKLLDISIPQYYKIVFFPLLTVVLVVYTINSIVKMPTDSFFELVLSLIVSFTITLLIILIIGLNKFDRQMAINFIKNKINVK